jgi:hypothetical protein
MIEYSYKGLDDLPVRTIQGMMESAIFEIARLQRELDAANKEIKQSKEPKKEVVQ